MISVSLHLFRFSLSFSEVCNFSITVFRCRLYYYVGFQVSKRVMRNCSNCGGTLSLIRLITNLLKVKALSNQYMKYKIILHVCKKVF